MAGCPHRKAIKGSDQLLFYVNLFINPQETTDQLCGFIHANGGDMYDRE